MAEAKTKPTNESVKEFLNRIPEAERREDCFAVSKIDGRDYGRQTEDVGTGHRRVR